MIQCNLESLLEAKGWTRYRLAIESGVHNAVLAKYAKNEVQEFNADTLNAICSTLGCDVGDLIGYVPEGASAIRFNLDKLLEARGWSAYRLSQESGIQQIVISKYKKNAVQAPPLATLAKLCAALQCQVGDLMEYVPASAAKRKRGKKANAKSNG